MSVTASRSSSASGRNAASKCSVWTRYQVSSQLPDGGPWLIGRVCRADRPSSTALFWHASGVNSDLVPDDLWERIAPLIPPRPPRRHRFPGRKPVDDRTALAGIVYVLRKGVSWADVPAERIGCLRGHLLAGGCGTGPRPGCGTACTRRCSSSCDVPTCWTWTTARSTARTSEPKRGGDHTGPSPVDRSRPGSKHHVIVDRHGTPLAVSLTGGNRHDVTQLIPLLDAIPRIRGRRGRPHHKPKRLYADRGYVRRRWPEHSRQAPIAQTLPVAVER
ncbi:IS5 family transposase [Streptomyces sp. enrichment culture]|uniref:IS5 family transposase n=1 Tax=Streptomyces sp. enrichment culture TaxID=1795815 RepID=UPI003F57C5C1